MEVSTVKRKGFNKGKLFKIMGIIAIVILILMYAVGVLFTNLVVKRRDQSFSEFFSEKESEMTAEEWEEANAGWYVGDELANRTQAKLDNDVWLETSDNEAVNITAFDGAELYGQMFLQENSDLWALVLHGYGSYSVEMLDLGRRFYDEGYNVIVPDMRGNSKSGGEYITFGSLDKYDISSWVDYIVGRNDEAEIVLHGSSMGAASVLMAVGENTLPSNVFAAVSDSAYTEVEQVIADIMKNRLYIPKFPLLYSTLWVAELHTGMDLTDISPKDAVQGGTLPILFMHSGGDEIIPPYMAQELYDSYTGTKDILITPDANHISGRYSDPDGYYSKLFEFIEAQRVS